jgi:phage tail-like protein
VTSKRLIIGVVLALLGIVALGGVAVLLGGGDERRLGATQDKRAYVSGNFFLEIDGVNVGALRSFEGCAAAGTVVDEQVGADQVVHKHVGNLAYEPCVIEVGSGMDAKLYEWIKDMLDRKATRHNLVIHSADYDFKVRSSTQLLDALLTKVKLPALDASSKDAASIELTIQAEVVKALAASGQPISGTSSKSAAQKKWLPSNFRFTLNGVSDLNRVNKISSFEVTQEVTQGQVGELRDYAQEPGKLRLGNLAVTIAESHSASLDGWFDDFLIKGNNAAANEKTGSIEFLSPNLQDVLFTLSLKGVGIFRGGGVTFEAKSEGIKRKTYLLYVEEASFMAGKGITTTTAPAPQPTSPQPSPTPSPTPPPPAPTATAASGAITPVDGVELADGQTFTISDGVNPPTTFEFDSDRAAKFVAVPFTKEDRAETVGTAIAETINGVAETLNVSAKFDGAVVALQNDNPGAAGNVPIEETVESERFVVKGMSGGTGEGVEKPAPQIPAPTALVAKTGFGEGEVDLSWQGSVGAIGYVVLFSLESGGERREIAETQDTSITLGGLKTGVPHYFVVRALTEAGDSPNSTEASAVPG